MSRPSKGTVAWRRDIETGRPCWHARYTRGDRTRTNWVPLDPDIHEDDVEGAQACAATLAPKAKATTKDGKGETVASYATRWLDEREGRVHSIRDDRSRMRDHALPVLGSLAARSFTRDDVERLRDDLDRKIEDGELAWKTAGSVWTLVTSMCADMVTAKKREFRVRDDNPCRDVKAPERGERKAKAVPLPVGVPPVRLVRAGAAPLAPSRRPGDLHVHPRRGAPGVALDRHRPWNHRHHARVQPA
jgi:hypothetical protein